MPEFVEGEMPELEGGVLPPLQTPTQLTAIIVPIACVIGLLYSFYLYKFVSKVRVKPFKTYVPCIYCTKHALS